MRFGSKQHIRTLQQMQPNQERGMKLRVELDLNNDAFHRNPLRPGELDEGMVAAMLDGVANRIQFGARRGNVKDINGNTVGHFAVEEK